jgi:hypothetical protein
MLLKSGGYMHLKNLFVAFSRVIKKRYRPGETLKALKLNA